MNIKMLLILLMLALTASLAMGQGIKLPWTVIDGGGGRSTGGGYLLSSSVGQPTIGLSTGSSFILEGGFLPGVRGLTGTTSTLDVHLISAWNLLSVPLISSDMRKGVLYPTAISNAFAYGGTGYVAKDTLMNGVGYWLKFPTGQTSTFTGTSFAPETINVVAGWNMFGTISYPALTANIIPLFGATIGSPYYGYSITGYFTEDTLKPASGYWVKIVGSGKLVISPAPAIPPAISSPTAMEKNRHPSGRRIDDILSGFQTLRVKDAREQERIVYFSTIHKDIDLTSFELPPVPPGEILDVRFKSQRMAEMPSTKGIVEFPLQISGAAFPVTFSWDVSTEAGSCVLEVRTIEDGRKQIPIAGKGSAIISDVNLVLAKIRITAESKVQLPEVYALYQNYPNPFNPLTTIRYDLPSSSRVNLRLYNLLGQEVMTLLDGEKDAGRYSIELDANTLPSGVYYYRLEAHRKDNQGLSSGGKVGDFTQIKKLLLLK